MTHISALLEAVQSWQRLVEQLVPYAGPNDDPADVLARLLAELEARRRPRAFPGSAPHDDALHPADVTEPSAPQFDAEDITYPGRPHSVFFDQHRRGRAAD